MDAVLGIFGGIALIAVIFIALILYVAADLESEDRR